MTEAQPNNLAHKIEAAKSLLAQKKEKDSLLLLKEIIHVCPDLTEAYELAIKASRQLDDAEGAVSFAAMGCMAIHSKKKLFLHQSYFIFQINQKWGMALSVSQDLLRNYEPSPDHYGKEINALIHLQRLEEAEHKIFSLRKLFPQDDTSYRFAVELYSKKRDRDRVKIFRRKLANKFSHEWRYQLDYAESLIEFGKDNKAKQVVSACYSSEILSKDATESPRVMQYFTMNPNCDANTLQKLTHANLKLQYQWNAWLNHSNNYNLVGEEEAAELINSWFGEEAQKLFLKCGPAAMQSDVFRVAFLAHHEHSLYIDWPLAPIPIHDHQNLLHSNRSILCKRMRGGEPRIWNGFAFNNKRSSICLLFQNILDRILHNIKYEVANDVWRTTGPMTWIQSLEETIHIEDKIMFKQFQSKEFNMFYPVIAKSSAQSKHWSKIQKEQSIFVSQPAK